MAANRPQPAAPHPVWNDGQPILLGQVGRFVGLAEPQRSATVEGFVTGLEWWAERESTHWLGASRSSGSSPRPVEATSSARQPRRPSSRRSVPLNDRRVDGDIWTTTTVARPRTDLTSRALGITTTDAGCGAPTTLGSTPGGRCVDRRSLVHC